jgi:hypothetical protein
MNSESQAPEEQTLRDKLRDDPADWESRRNLAHTLYNQQAFEEAAELVWDADPIPSTDIDLAFAARILAKAKPRWVIRLLTAILEQNRGKAVQNLGMANALLHHGMVLQAARFYGAAIEADPTLANPDLEHFVLWTDDEQTLWGDFNNRRPALGDLPWMVRDSREALRLHEQLSGHTTPVYVPKLAAVPGENLQHPIYQQQAALSAKITPPPAVTIPIDRVAPKDRRFDATYGAEVADRDQAASVENPPPAAMAPAVAPSPILRRPQIATPSRLTPSPDAPPRKTTVMPIQFPPPTTSLQTVQAPAQPAPRPSLPHLPPADSASPTRRRLVVPGLNKPPESPATSSAEAS